MNTICDECGREGEMMASASSGNETRYFCHNERRSCYNKRRGHYFDKDYPARQELLGEVIRYITKNRGAIE